MSPVIKFPDSTMQINARVVAAFDADRNLWRGAMTASTPEVKFNIEKEFGRTSSWNVDVYGEIKLNCVALESLNDLRY